MRVLKWKMKTNYNVAFIALFWNISKSFFLVCTLCRRKDTYGLSTSIQFMKYLKKNPQNYRSDKTNHPMVCKNGTVVWHFSSSQMRHTQDQIKSRLNPKDRTSA